MKLTLPVAKYNKLIDCLNKTNQTLDEVILQCNKDRLDSFKELDALEDSEVVKKVIERINANNEKFSYQKIAKEFKIDSFEAMKIHDYLEYSGYINNPSLHKKAVSNFGEETKEIEYELPQEIIGELDTYYEKFNLCRERLDLIDISNFINKNQTFDDDNLPEYLKYLVESIKTKEIRKEQVTISYIQRTFSLGFATAFKVKQYLEEKKTYLIFVCWLFFGFILFIFTFLQLLKNSEISYVKKSTFLWFKLKNAIFIGFFKIM